MQALSDIDDGPLVVLLRSAGGSPTATESIVHLLRSRFDPIRVLILHTAKSAATMLALSGNEIVLGEAAEFGPIDPQVQFITEQRAISVPARAAIDKFELAASEIDADPGKIRGMATHYQTVRPRVLARMPKRTNSFRDACN